MRSVHNEEVGREGSAPKSYLVAMPTPLVEQKAASGSDRYSEVVPGSPESLARGMFPKGLPRNPRELAVSARESGKADIEGRPKLETADTAKGSLQHLEPPLLGTTDTCEKRC